MKKQSSRARAQQSTPPVRHQLEHAVPTVIHNPEEDMTALGRWAHHAMLEPGRYLGWPLAIIGGVVLLAVILQVATGGSKEEVALWNKLESAKTPAERVDIAKTDPKSPAASWAMLQAATEFFNQALADMPGNRDVAQTASKKALDLFEEVGRTAPHDSPQARVAAMGKARTLEMRNDLPKAIEQYERVAREWPETPEAEEAKGYAEALKDPQATNFYKELYAYKPPSVTLPPEGTETFTTPAPGGIKAPVAPAGPPSETPPTLSPGLGAIPGIREVVEPKPAAPAKADLPKPAAPAKADQPKPAAPAKADQPKPVATEARPQPPAQPAKPAETPQKKELPAEVFAPKAGESKPR